MPAVNIKEKPRKPDLEDLTEMAYFFREHIDERERKEKRRKAKCTAK